MILSPEIARDIRNGAIFNVEGERIGLRQVKRLWFNYGSGHYIADCGSCYMYTDEPENRWRIVPNSMPSNRKPNPQPPQQG